jgi:hypothetical protein
VTKDCANDCLDPLRFPRVVDNRAGLSHIRYRLGSYADIREFLLRNLDKTLGLSQWTHRGADDPGIALLEGAAILGDILTFYQELYANEAFLRTAQWRESIADLVRLLGYRLSPGLGGRATFAFEIKGDQPVTIPTGFPVKAEVEGLDQPADFETSEAAIGYPWLSKFNLFRPLVWPLVTSATKELYIETPDQLTSPVALKDGDRLLVGVAAASAPGRIDNSEIVIVDSTRVLHGRTLIKIKGALKPTTNAASLVAYKLGRSFRHFGHNGPQTKLVPPESVTSTSTTLATTIQPPPVTVIPPSMQVTPPPVTVTPPSMEVTPPSMSVTPPPMPVTPPLLTIPVEGNTLNLLHSIRIPSASPQVIEVLPGLIPTTWITSTGAVTVQPPGMTVQPPDMPVYPPEMTVYPPAVMVQPQPVTAQPPPLTVVPPLLPIPPQEITTTTDVPPPTEQPINFFRDLNFPATTDPSWSVVEPSLNMKEFPLDAEVQDLPAGGSLVAQFTAYTNFSHTQKDERTVVRTIAGIKPISMTWGLLTSSASLVTLTQTLQTEAPVGHLSADIREFQFHETLSPQLTLKAAMQETTLPSGKDLYFFGPASQAPSLSQRRVFLVKVGADPVAATVVSVQPAAVGPNGHPLLHRITLNREVGYADFPNEKPGVMVYGNLADATQGKRESPAPLGNGDARLVFQTFKVPKAPVTYLISNNDTPPEVPELQIYVNDRRWKRVPSFFNRRPKDEIYIVREDPDNVSWVQFGDGQTGTRLPSGVKNVVARYRTGTGAFGALKAGTKVQAGGKLERLERIQMPDVAAGGSPPEDGENARAAAPGKIQSLDRLVSLEDFESETLAISGVTKAAAAWQRVDNIPLVVLTVLMDTGRGAEIDDVRATLTGYNHGRGPSRFPIEVLQGQRQYVVIGVTFGYDSTYEEDDVRKAIQRALGVNSGKPKIVDDQSGLFSLGQRGFGQREYASSIAGTVQQVAGVTWAYVTRFESLGVIADPTVFTTPVTPVVIQPTVPCDSQHVLSMYAGHLQLTGVAEIVPEMKR